MFFLTKLAPLRAVATGQVLPHGGNATLIDANRVDLIWGIPYTLPKNEQLAFVFKIMVVWETMLVLRRLIFRDYVSFREGSQNGEEKIRQLTLY